MEENIPYRDSAETNEKKVIKNSGTSNMTRKGNTECFSDFSSLASRMPRLFDCNEQNLRNLLSEGCCDDR